MRRRELTIAAVALGLMCGVGGLTLAPHRAAAAPVAATVAAPHESADVAAPATLDSAAAIARVRAAFTPANRRYAHVREALALVEPFWDVAIAWLLLATGIAAVIRDLARRRFRRRYARVLVFVILAGLVAFGLHLPFDFFRDYWWEHRFGLSNQTAAAWLLEQVEVFGLNVAAFGATGLVALALWGIEAAGRRWWLWLGLGTLPVAVAAVLLQPLVFDPAFNTFRPLGDHALDRRILALAARAHIPARHVFEVDKSRQTRTVNAYVSGFGPSQRIVIWDTTLARLDHDEILFVVGHEMGHYRLLHLWQGVFAAWLGSFALYFAAARILERCLRRYGAPWRIASLADEAAMPLFAAVFGILLVVAGPAANAFSRRIEHEADVYGLEATRLNDAAARTFIAFGEDNRSDPDPPALLRVLLYTHPPLIDRVRFAVHYHPWTAGRANRFYTGAAPPP